MYIFYFNGAFIQCFEPCFFSPGSSMYLWNLWGNIVLKLGTHVRLSKFYHFWIPPPPEFLGSFGVWTSKFRGHPQTTNKGTRLTLYTCNLLGRNKSKQLGFGSLDWMLGIFARRCFCSKSQSSFINFSQWICRSKSGCRSERSFWSTTELRRCMWPTS